MVSGSSREYRRASVWRKCGAERSGVGGRFRRACDARRFSGESALSTLCAKTAGGALGRLEYLSKKLGTEINREQKGRVFGTQATLLAGFRQSGGGKQGLKRSGTRVNGRERPIWALRGGQYALQRLRTRVLRRDFGGEETAERGVWGLPQSTQRDRGGGLFP